MYIAGNHPGGLEGLLCSFPGMWHAKYMRWTTEPTEPGLYRVFHKYVGGKFGHKSWSSWEELQASGNSLVIDFREDVQDVKEYIEIDIKDGFTVYWLGPLPVPEPPTESETK